jgi:hypothetical protein
VALDKQASRATADRHGRGVEERPAWNHVFRLPYVRKNLFGRLPRASRHARERERRSHQFQERASLDRIERCGQPRREFVADQLIEVRPLLFFERPPEFRSAVGPHR